MLGTSSSSGIVSISKIRTPATHGNIRHIYQLLQSGINLTVIVIVMEVEESHDSTFASIGHKLVFSKVCTRWVPCLRPLSENFFVCSYLIVAEGLSFLIHIIITDGSSLMHFTLESKLAAKEWRKEEKPGQIKDKSLLPAVNFMITVRLWTSWLVLYYFFAKMEQSH